MRNSAAVGQANYVRSILFAAVGTAILAASVPCPATALAPPAKAGKLTAVKEFRTPKELLAWIYAHYVSKSSGLNLDNSELSRIFTSRMTDLIVRADKASQILQEESAGAAPWIGAQDYEIRSVKVETKDAGKGKITGIVTYTNLIEQKPKPHTYTFTILSTDHGWRIDEIHYPKNGISALSGPTYDLSDSIRRQIEEASKVKR